MAESYERYRLWKQRLGRGAAWALCGSADNEADALTLFYNFQKDLFQGGHGQALKLEYPNGRVLIFGAVTKGDVLAT